MKEGKIIKALSGFYYVLSDDQLIQCRGRGVFRKKGVTPLVGDHVIFQATNEHEGYIMDVKERKNELTRPPIANVDQAILVFSATEPDFSPILLDRLLVKVEYNRITPIIIITKLDLLLEEQLTHISNYKTIYEKIGYDVILTSALTKDGMDRLSLFLQEKTSVLAGQSGVGKSSLLNALVPDLHLKTAKISTHLGRGRHTTRHVEFMQIAGGLVADTPGFSSIEFSNIELTELGETFPEIAEESYNCKFRACLHINEPHCAVKKAVDSDQIASHRYRHYLQFTEEIKARKPRY